MDTCWWHSSFFCMAERQDTHYMGYPSHAHRLCEDVQEAPGDTVRQRAAFGLCMPSRQSCLEPGTAAFMGCGSARQTGCMRQLPGKHCGIRQAAEWLFRPAHGVWGQGCAGEGGGSDITVPLWYLLHASSWGPWLEPARGQRVKAKGGVTLPKTPRDAKRE